MSITPELQAFLAHPQLQPHADRLLKILDNVPVSRQGALVRFLEGLMNMDGKPSADAVLSATEQWPAIVGPFARETGLVMALAMFCHEHPRELSDWLADRGLDGKLIDPWIAQWLHGRAALENLYRANNTSTTTTGEAP